MKLLNLVGIADRAHQAAGTLPYGHQRKLEIARALALEPELLLLDEPSLGLAPILIKEIFKELKRINGEGVTMLLVEQNARQALALSNRGYVLQTGRIVLQGPSQELLVNPDVTAAYLGKLKK
jgi:branched-chain amino acid transport system ATP-binding protein